MGAYGFLSCPALQGEMIAFYALASPFWPALRLCQHFGIQRRRAIVAHVQDDLQFFQQRQSMFSRLMDAKTESTRN